MIHMLTEIIGSGLGGEAREIFNELILLLKHSTLFSWHSARIGGRGWTGRKFRGLGTSRMVHIFMSLIH